MTDIIVVVGTGRRTGKTRVATALARALADKAPTVALKAIEVGCRGERAGPMEDGVALARATGQEGPRAALCRLEPDLPPPLAAERAGGRLGWPALVKAIEGAMAPARIGLVEGTGGVMTPLTWEKDALDMAAELKARLLIVAPARRGSVSDVRAAVRAAKASKVPVAGIVITEIEPPPEPVGLVLSGGPKPKPGDAMIAGTVPALERYTDLPPITLLPHVESLGIAARVLEPLAARLLGR